MIIEKIELENFMCYAGKNSMSFKDGINVIIEIMGMENQNYMMHFIGYYMIKYLFRKRRNFKIQSL